MDWIDIRICIGSSSAADQRILEEANIFRFEFPDVGNSPHLCRLGKVMGLDKSNNRVRGGK